jgi:hypothetical protein
MTDIVLTPIASGYNLSKINTNFDVVEDVINNGVVHVSGGGNIMEQALDMNGNDLLNVHIDPDDQTGLVVRQELTDEINARVSGDVSLQDQLNGTNPPMGSAFSTISWHGQRITNSITIPDNVNAWSFGPLITLDPGVVVTIGTGSFWTVAFGEVV